jgi:hypothetical protein
MPCPRGIQPGTVVSPRSLTQIPEALGPLQRRISEIGISIKSLTRARRENSRINDDTFSRYFLNEKPMGLHGTEKSGRNCAVEVEKLLDEWICRGLADLLGGADLLDGALVDDDDAVGDFKSFLLIMSDEEAGQVCSIVKAAQPMAQFLAHLGIERPEWFIQEEDFGLDSQGASESHALALAAGKLAGKASRSVS